MDDEGFKFCIGGIASCPGKTEGVFAELAPVVIVKVVKQAGPPLPAGLLNQPINVEFTEPWLRPRMARSDRPRFRSLNRPGRTTCPPHRQRPPGCPMQ